MSRKPVPDHVRNDMQSGCNGRRVVVFAGGAKPKALKLLDRMPAIYVGR